MIRSKSLSEWVYTRRGRRSSKEVRLHGAPRKTGREEASLPGGHARGISDSGDATRMVDVGQATAVSPRSEVSTLHRHGVERGLQSWLPVRCSHERVCQTNMLSATRNKQAVDEYLDKEVSLGRVAGPIDPTAQPEIHINRFGVIEKPNHPGKYRLIVDLSYKRATARMTGWSLNSAR